MNKIISLAGLEVSKIICYQHFYTDGPPSLDQQKDFMQCDPVILWTPNENGIRIASYQNDSFWQDGYAHSLFITRLSDLPFSWHERRERLISCDNVKEVSLNGFENNSISSVTFYGEKHVIQSMVIHFTNKRKLHLFCGDCDCRKDDSLFIRRDDEYVMLFFEDSDYLKYDLQHGKPILSQSI